MLALSSGLLPEAISCQIDSVPGVEHLFQNVGQGCPEDPEDNTGIAIVQTLRMRSCCFSHWTRTFDSMFRTASSELRAACSSSVGDQPVFVDAGMKAN